MSKKQKDYYDALDRLLDRPIAFNPAFKKITGRTSAAVWLSQIYYWSKRTNDPNGWFWKTAKECQEETGLTDNEQKTAREICVKLGVVEEKLKGVPATMHYRLIKSRMYELLGVQFPTEQETEIPVKQETTFPQNGEPVSDRVVNINRNTETTPETTQTNEFPVDWKLGHGQPITSQDLDEAKIIDQAPKMFEKAFGFGKLPWGSNKTWQDFQKFIIDIYRHDRLAFGNFVIWRANGGKYKGWTNKTIRTNPQVFMDTGWFEFTGEAQPSASSAEPTPEQLAEADRLFGVTT